MRNDETMGYFRSESTRPGERLDVPRRKRLRSSFRFRLAEFDGWQVTCTKAGSTGILERLEAMN